MRRAQVQLVLQAVAVFAVVATLVLVSVSTWVLLGNSAKATQQREAQLALAQLLVECTTAPELRTPPVKAEDVPDDDCYARQQAATGAVVGEPAGPINTVAVAAAACGAAHPGDVPGTLRCTRAAVGAR